MKVFHHIKEKINTSAFKIKNQFNFHNWQSFSLITLETLRSKRKLAVVTMEIQEITRNNQLQNTLDPGMAQEYISQDSEAIERRVTKKFSEEFTGTESRILGALSKLDEFISNPQVRTSSLAVPRTSRNNDSENQEPTGDISLDILCP